MDPVQRRAGTRESKLLPTAGLPGLHKQNSGCACERHEPPNILARFSNGDAAIIGFSELNVTPESRR